MDDLMLRMLLSCLPRPPDRKESIKCAFNPNLRGVEVKGAHRQVKRPASPKQFLSDGWDVFLRAPHSRQSFARVERLGSVAQMPRAARGQENLHKPQLCNSACW